MATVQAVLVDVAPFLALGLIALFGFALGSYVLYPQGHKGLFWMMQVLFYALLGDNGPFVSHFV